MLRLVRNFTSLIFTRDDWMVQDEKQDKICSLYCLFEFQNFMLEFFVALIIVDLFLRIHKGLELSAHDKSLSQIKQISGVAQLF